MKQVRKFGEPIKTTQESTTEMEKNVGPDFGSMMMMMMLMKMLNPQGGGEQSMLAPMAMNMPGRESPFPALAPTPAPQPFGEGGLSSLMPMTGGVSGSTGAPDMSGLIKMLMAILGGGNAGF